MKTPLSLVFVLLAVGLTSAQIPEGQTIRDFSEIDFRFQMDQVRRSALVDHLKLEMEPQADANSAASAPLKISYAGVGPLQLRVLMLGLGSGVISTHHYAITGEVSCENVAAGSYLEMWSYFASPAPGYPEGSYFSRTMADSGPMGKLDGTSGWREFWLPFDASAAKTSLVRLEMNLHLGGPGTVHLRNLKLMQYPDAPATAVHVPSTAVGAGGLVVVSVFTIPGSTQLAYGIGGTSFRDCEAVRYELASRHTADPRLQVVIRADKDVPYDSVRALLDAAASAGVANVSFATASPSQNASNIPASDASGTTTAMTLAQVGNTTTTEHLRALKILWFCLGMVATTGLLLAGVAITYVSRLWQRRQHERELRRMASLDG